MRIMSKMYLIVHVRDMHICTLYVTTRIHKNKELIYVKLDIYLKLNVSFGIITFNFTVLRANNRLSQKSKYKDFAKQLSFY